MNYLFPLVLSVLLNATPVDLSSNPITKDKKLNQEKDYSTTEPTTVRSEIPESKTDFISHFTNSLNATTGISNTYECVNSCTTKGSITSTSTTSQLSISDKLTIAAFALILVFGVFGNAYVIYVFLFTFKQRNVTETMLIYLAFVDLFASLINPVLFIYWITTTYSRWDFGITGCKLLPPVGPISTTASTAIIIVICLDRYRSIVTPFSTRLSKLRVHIMCSFAIVISVVFYSYYISALSISSDGKCQVQEVNELSYSIPNITITLLWDVAYIIVFVPTNIRVFRHLRLSRELQSDVSYSRIRRRENRKVMRVLCTVGVVFGILVFPKDILHLTYVLSWMGPNGIPRTPLLLTLNSWFKVLQVSNSCVNIFIYSKTHTRFRSEITNFFRRLLRRPPVQLENETYEDKTNVSIDDNDGANGGFLKIINEKIVKRLSPRLKRKAAAHDNGELALLSPSSQSQNLAGNDVESSAKTPNSAQLHRNGGMGSPIGTSSIVGKNKKSDKRLLLDERGPGNDQHSSGSEEEDGFIKHVMANKESQFRKEDRHGGLTRAEYYSQGVHERPSDEDAIALEYSSNVQDNGLCDQDGGEVAKVLESFKKSGINSKETNC